MSGFVTDAFLDTIKRNADNLLVWGKEYYGFPTEVYYPLPESANIYGSFDNPSFSYSDDPDLSGNFLILGDILGKRYLSDETIDTFTGNEVYMLVESSIRVDVDSKVLVRFVGTASGSVVYPFRTRKPEVGYSRDNIVYQRISLVPYSVEVTQ